MPALTRDRIKRYSVNPARLYQVMDAAHANTGKPPVIRLTCMGEPVKFKLSRIGWIYINGANFGTTYASISRNGAVNLYIDQVLSKEWGKNLLKLIALLCRDPQTVCAAYGHREICCSFCGRELTDERSVTVGYGPICAGYYGLPWGETA